MTKINTYAYAYADIFIVWYKMLRQQGRIHGNPEPTEDAHDSPPDNSLGELHRR